MGAISGEHGILLAETPNPAVGQTLRSQLIIGRNTKSNE